MNKSFEKINYIFRLSIFCFLVGLTNMGFSAPSGNCMAATYDSCPTVSFTVSNNGCIGPCEITFHNQSQGATSYHWDFGDGNTSIETNPTHSYQIAGTYSVTLTAFIDGCQQSFIGIVDVVVS